MSLGVVLRPAAIAAALAVLTAVPLAAQEPVRSFSDLTRLLRPGETIWIVDDTGRQTAVRLRSITPGALVAQSGEEVREWQPSSVALVRARRQDALWNGLGWGLATGGALGALAGARCANDFGCRGGAGGFVLVSGAFGAGVGLGIDALIRSPRIVYRRPADAAVHLMPMVGPKTRGVTVAVAWR